MSSRALILTASGRVPIKMNIRSGLDTGGVVWIRFLSAAFGSYNPYQGMHDVGHRLGFSQYASKAGSRQRTLQRTTLGM